MTTTEKEDKPPYLIRTKIAPVAQKYDLYLCTVFCSPCGKNAIISLACVKMDFMANMTMAVYFKRKFCENLLVSRESKTRNAPGNIQNQSHSFQFKIVDET